MKTAEQALDGAMVLDETGADGVKLGGGSQIADLLSWLNRILQYWHILACCQKPHQNPAFALPAAQ